MPAALELSFQPNLNHTVDQFPAQEIRRQAKDVGVVMAAAHLRSDAIVARSRANAGNLVGGDAHADTGAADQDATIDGTFADRLGDLKGIIGIIDALAAAGSHVDYVMAKALQERDNTPFYLKAPVVATDCDFHGLFVFRPEPDAPA